MADYSDYSYPRSRYYGETQPENLIFHAKLQEFARRVANICCIETNENISLVEAYEKLQDLWEELQQTKQQLKIGESSFQDK